MGVFGLLRLFSFWVSLFFFSFCFRGLIAEEDVRKTPPSNTVEDFSPDIATANFPPPPPPPPPPPSPVFRGKSNIAPFKPSIAVIVGVLTTMFSVTFLLLLYAKHCKRNNGGGANAGNPSSGAPASSTARRNSGIDRSVIESLPIFRFGSLRGQKDGLECAVCLTRFESTEVLRLLPKCKHAFHVECVDTWLDAHSTCPLCRYRVDPEDVLLVDDMKLGEDNGEQRHEAAEAVEDKAEQHQSVVSIEDLQSRGSEAGSETRTPNQSLPNPLAETACGFRRISGRHSSAEEKASRYLQILVHQPSDSDSSSRRSLDSVNLKRKNESVSVGCFDRGGRKDGLLLPEAVAAETETQERRLEHRIIISASEPGEFQHRWSDLHPSDLLFLRSEMIITNSGRYSLPPIPSNHHHHHRHNPRNQEQQKRQESRGEGGEGVEENIDVNGRSVINARSVSEITGLSRFPNRTSGHYHRHHQHHQPEREARFVDRWLAWASHLRSTAHHTNQ